MIYRGIAEVYGFSFALAMYSCQLSFVILVRIWYYARMHPESVQGTLQLLGLNEKEIVIYLALLSVGTAPASTLGQRTQITRSTAQYTCQQLAKKGIVTMVQKSNTYLYAPEPPEKLLLLLQKQQEELRGREQQVHRIIGTLKGMMNPHAVLPKVRFFEGREGILEAYDIMLHTIPNDGEVVIFLHPLVQEDDQFDLMPSFNRISEEFNKKHLYDRTISPRSKYSEELQKYDEPPLRETRLMEMKGYLDPMEIIISGSSMYAIGLEKNQLFGFFAENAPITGMLRAIFNELWEKLPSTAKKKS